MSEENAVLTSNLLTIYREMLKAASRIENEIGFDGLVELIQKDKAPRINKPNSKAELYLIDGIPTVRVIDRSSEIAYIFMTPEDQNVLFKDPRSVSLDSNHLKRVEARQHVDAGKDRTDGQTGRDVIFVLVKNEKIQGTIESPRPVALNKKDPRDYARWAFEHTKDYLRATSGGRPTTQQLLWATFVGAAQAGMVIGLAAAKQHLHPALHPIDVMPSAKITAEFGFIMTAFTSTIRNWQNRGKTGFLNYHPSSELEFEPIDKNASLTDKAKEYARRAIIKTKHLDIKETLTSRNARIGFISLAYSYSLLFMLDSSITTVTYLAPKGFGQRTKDFIMAQTIALPNLFMNNANKIWVYEPSVLKSQMRLNTMPFLNFNFSGKKFIAEQGEIDLPGLRPIKKELSWYDIQYQSAYLLKSLPLKLADLMSINIPTPWGMIPISRIALFLSVPYLRWRAVLVAEKIDHPAKVEMRKEFEDTWYMKKIRKVICAKSASAESSVQ